VELFVSPDVGDYLQNEKRVAIEHIEQANSKKVVIHSSPQYAGERSEIVCQNDRGSVVKL
jgi:Ribonuclease G/E